MAFVTLLLFILVLAIPIIGIYLAGLWKIFKKAGRSGWEAIIPFYNTWVLAEISGTAWWYALIIILSSFGLFGDGELGVIFGVVAFVARFFIYYNLSCKFHQDIGIAILMTFFPVIMIPIVGFSNSFQFDKDVVVSENGPIDSNNKAYSSESNYTSDSYGEKHYCQYCGKPLSVDAKFCGNCGHEIKK